MSLAKNLTKARSPARPQPQAARLLCKPLTTSPYDQLRRTPNLGRQAPVLATSPVARLHPRSTLATISLISPTLTAPTPRPRTSLLESRNTQPIFSATCAPRNSLVHI